MKPPLRIAILECDTPLDGTREKYGDYGGVFKALLEAAADGLQNPDLSSKKGLQLSKWHVQRDQEYPPLEDIDAVLLTGSRYNSFDDDPWILKLVEFTRKLLDQDRIRIIGVCFGHQILGRALGAKVGRNDAGWEVAVLPMDLTDTGKKLFKKDQVSLHQMHRDIVFDYPDRVEPLGSSSRCSVQGMYSKKRFISVQGHPEFNEQIVRELCESRHNLAIFSDEVYEDALPRIASHHDGVAVAEGFLRFLLEE